MPTPPTHEEMLAVGVAALPAREREETLPVIVNIAETIADMVLDAPREHRSTLTLAAMAALVRGLNGESPAVLRGLQ